MAFAVFLAPIAFSPPKNLTVLVYVESAVFFVALIISFVVYYGIALTLTGILYLAHRLCFIDSNAIHSSYCSNFWEGLIFDFSNYKVIYAAIFAQAFWKNKYGNLTYSNIPPLYSFLFLWDFWAICSGFVLRRMERFVKIRQRLFSLSLVGFAIWLVVVK